MWRLVEAKESNKCNYCKKEIKVGKKRWQKMGFDKFYCEDCFFEQVKELMK